MQIFMDLLIVFYGRDCVGNSHEWLFHYGEYFQLQILSQLPFDITGHEFVYSILGLEPLTNSYVIYSYIYYLLQELMVFNRPEFPYPCSRLYIPHYYSSTTTLTKIYACCLCFMHEGTDMSLSLKMFVICYCQIQ